MEEKLYLVMNLHEDFDNCPWVVATSPQEALDKASAVWPYEEYLTNQERDEGDVIIHEITNDKVSHKVYSYDFPEGEWVVDYEETYLR